CGAHPGQSASTFNSPEGGGPPRSWHLAGALEQHPRSCPHGSDTGAAYLSGPSSEQTLSRLGAALAAIAFAAAKDEIVAVPAILLGKWHRTRSGRYSHLRSL